VFNSPLEQFDPKKHSILFRFNQGSLLRKETSNVAVQVMGVGDSGIVISHVVDAKTGSVNDLLTPNRNLKIKGGKLKIAGDNEANGVYFVNQNTQERLKVDAADIVTNKPSELIVHIPNLLAGMYKLEVTTQYAVSSLLKEPRSTVFEKILTV
jgi:predicted GTPase